MAVALAVAERALKGRGACRVHGGGFAGTIQAFVPLELLDGFREQVESVLGTGSCHVQWAEWSSGPEQSSIAAT